MDDQYFRSMAARMKAAGMNGIDNLAMRSAGGATSEAESARMNHVRNNPRSNSNETLAHTPEEFDQMDRDNDAEMAAAGQLGDGNAHDDNLQARMNSLRMISRR